jgi:hypothetical protein
MGTRAECEKTSNKQGSKGPGTLWVSLGRGRGGGRAPQMSRLRQHTGRGGTPYICAAELTKY